MSAGIAARIALDGNGASRTNQYSSPLEGEAGWGGCLPQGKSLKGVTPVSCTEQPPHPNLPLEGGGDQVRAGVLDGKGSFQGGGDHLRAGAVQTASAGAPTGNLSSSGTPTPTGTGRLRNGNPPGDLRLARRCGARTRAGHGCGQPAMKNTRCRLHGGKSTGPRTVDGLERSRRARLVHGLRGREYAALRRDGMAIRRRINGLCAEIAARMALDGGGSVRVAGKEVSSPSRGEERYLDPTSALSPVGMGFIVVNRAGCGGLCDGVECADGHSPVFREIIT